MAEEQRSEDQKAGRPEGQKPDDNGELSGQQRSADAPPASWDEVFQHERFRRLLKRAKDAEGALERLAKGQEEAEQAKLREQQKFQELFEKEQARAAKLDEELKASQRAAANDRKRRAVEDAARAHEPRFSAEAIRDVPVFVDLDALEIGEDGAVKGVELAIKTLAKDRPYLLEQKRQDPGSPAGRKPAGAPQPAQAGRRPMTL